MDWLRAIFSIVLVSVLPQSVWAQDGGTCDEETDEGPVEMTPASGSQDVTLDAFIKWRYTRGHFTGWGADPRDSIAVFRDIEDAEDEPVDGEAQIVGDYLYFIPAEPLLPDTDYKVDAFGLDFSLTGFEFHTLDDEDAVDSDPPDLQEISDVVSTGIDQSCEAPDGGYRVDVSFEPATDDGSAGSIEYLLYVSRGPTIEAPELRTTARNFTAGGEGLVTMAFVLSPDEAVGPVCVVVHAVDGVGRVDQDTPPYCFEPIQGNFFEGLCSVGGRPAPSLVFVLLSLVLLRRRCRR